MTAEEIEAYRAEYTGNNKGLLDSFEFWLEFRPDVLKRHKARTRHYRARSSPAPARRAPRRDPPVHDHGLPRGRRLRDPPRADQRRERTDILDTLSVAFIHSGHRGMYAAAAYSDYLRDVRRPAAAAERLPAGWRVRPGGVRLGHGPRAREASARGHGRASRTGIEQTLGEVPRYVRFLARNRPGLLKAYRDRYEHAIRDSLPCQMLPWLMLNYNVVRGFAEGIRENVLLGRALGMTREQLLDAICFGGAARRAPTRSGSPRRPPATCWRRSRGVSAAIARVRRADADRRRPRLRRARRWRQSSRARRRRRSRSSPTAASRRPARSSRCSPASTASRCRSAR